MKKYSNFLMSNTTFSPHYVSYKSVEYSQEKNLPIPNCIGKGLYCALPRYDLGIVNGRNIIIENIRQKCIFNISKKKFISENYKLTEANLLSRNSLYFDYMANFKENCINKTSNLDKNSENNDENENNFDTKCANKVLKIIGLNTKLVDECIKASYISEDNTKNLYKILEEENSAKNFYQIKILPSILVNKKPIVSNFNAMNIMEAICSGFSEKPYYCNEIMEEFKSNGNNKESDGKSIGFNVYFILIVIAIGLNALIFLYCKCYLNTRIKNKLEEVDMNGTISSVMSNYLKLRNTN